ncbi:MAG: ATP-binding protein [Anaerolineae bacterium]|nr:ATP-binding protein [Anaerolineae bacterium]
MDWQHTPYTLPLLGLTLLFLALATLVWQRRSANGAAPLALLILAVAFWSFTYALQLAGADLKTQFLWARVKYVGVTSISPLWLVFALTYTGRTRWLTRPVCALLALFPLVFTTLMWTTESHGLMWHDIRMDERGDFLTVYGASGVAFWVHALLAYGMFLVGAWLLSGVMLRAGRGLYRWQGRLMLSGLFIPLISNALYISGIEPFGPIDPTPFAFSLSSLALAGGLFRLKLLDVVPIARDMLIETMDDPMIVLDRLDRVVDLNAAAERVLGCAEEHAVGKPAAQALGPLVMSLAGGPESTAKPCALTVCESGESRWYDVRVSPLRNGDDRDHGRLVVLHDITERRKSEELVRHYASEMELRNAELDSFSHTVAHNLKTPLGLVLGYAGLIASDVDRATQPSIYEMAQIIERTALTMSGMITSLLMFAQLHETAQMVGPVDMTLHACAAVDRLQMVIAGRSVRVTVDPDLPPALAYGPWVEEVFAILIDNAIKYMAPDNPAPRVIVRGNRLPEGDVVRYEVQDNGVGISPHDQERLFAPLTRLKQVDVEGFGMGLTIAQRIVRKLNGTLGVESEVEAGSTFWFTLPAVPAPVEGAAQPVSAPTASA